MCSSALREREEARARQEAERQAGIVSDAPEVTADDSDLKTEERIAAMLEDQLSEEDEDLMDDIGLDMNQIVSHMAKQAQSFSEDETKKD